MKIQSRPPASLAPAFERDEFVVYLRNVMEITGSGTSDVYRKVLAEGAGSLLVQMGVIDDYQVMFSNRGHYGICMDIKAGEGGYHTLHL